MKKLISILTLYLVATMVLSSQEFAGSSVLAQGRWHKIKILKEGIYRIDFSDLAALGLSPGNEPALYSNNYGLLSYYNDEARPDDLVKTAIYLERGQDGIFNDGDYILFYGNATHRWEYKHDEKEYFFSRHHYSDTAVYFLRLNASPLEISNDADPGAANTVSDHSDYLFIHETEKQNIMKSGREWYEPLAANVIYPVNTDIENHTLAEGALLHYRIRVLGRSPDPVVMRLKNGEELMSSVMIPQVNINNTAGTYANPVEETGEIDLSSGFPGLFVSFHNNGNITARGWLDYLELQTRIRNNFNQTGPGHFIIRDRTTVQEGNVSHFRISSDFDDLLVWDISCEHNIKSMQLTYSSQEYSFICSSDSLRKFIAFRPPGAMKPLIDKDPIANQDLHREGRYDMIIISHPLFYNYAVELADIHLLNDSLHSIVLTPGEIYNEFSGGVPDISALRNYIRMVYMRNKNSDRPLKYLLLFGDGSYENRTPPPDNPNFIPTYQTRNSHVRIQSFTSDDYYGLLDAGEGEYEGLLDIGIGRLPVSSTEQAEAMIGKIRDYINAAAAGPWKNIITMLADDEDNNLHMNDSDKLAEIIESEEPAFNIEKIYLDSYKQTTSISGQSYPDAVKAINDRINNGCLLLNYSGHGNEMGLAHERVLDAESINSWSNKGKYPVFVTATCEFSRFDDISLDPGTGSISEKTSAGELVLLKPEGGAIALFSTTRIVFASHNYNLASKLYEHAFQRDASGRGLSMGEIMRLAKINTSGDNKRNFTLLGDPALRLAWPWHGSIITDSINGQSITEFNDTIMGLSELTVSGHIEDRYGNMMNTFNTYLHTSLYDKGYETTSLANDGGQPFTYTIRDRVLFKGKAELVNGRFRVSMLIPRDIDYTFGPGKLSYYAAGDYTDYTGSHEDFVIGGLANPAIIDTTGPVIELFLNDTLFRSGGITDASPVLLARLNDAGSINTTGAGIGHDIVAIINNEHSNTIILNNYYENDPGTYKSGKLIYPLGKLERGEHTISLKAWDNFNNSSTASLLFFVRDEEGLILNKLINYPNPFTNETNISLEHNRPDDFIEIFINIYSGNGKLLKTIEAMSPPGGYRIPPIRWDGRDDNGARVAAGIYLYTLTVRTGGNETARSSGRMIIL
ncbi:MAG: type IX secretion system sortase PorU [Bacteroidales bacterium]|nr:type IX secretion system sortase PorU [Bacteroidales bacterium]